MNNKTQNIIIAVLSTLLVAAVFFVPYINEGRFLFANVDLNDANNRIPHELNTYEVVLSPDYDLIWERVCQYFGGVEKTDWSGRFKTNDGILNLFDDCIVYDSESEFVGQNISLRQKDCLKIACDFLSFIEFEPDFYEIEIGPSGATVALKFRTPENKHVIYSGDDYKGDAFLYIQYDQGNINYMILRPWLIVESAKVDVVDSRTLSERLRTAEYDYFYRPASLFETLAMYKIHIMSGFVEYSSENTLLSPGSKLVPYIHSEAYSEYPFNHTYCKALEIKPVSLTE